MKVRLLLLCFLPILVSTSTVGIYAIEGSHDGSEFHSLFNSFWWTIVTFTTVGYGDLSPATTEGRLFGVLVLFAGVVIHSVIISLISNWYFQYQSTAERGLKPMRLKHHTLICSDRPDFIEAMIEENMEEYRAGQIVVVAAGSESPLAGSPLYRKTPWVRGEGHEVAVLRRAGVKRAKRAYVAYEDDGMTVMTVIHIRGETGARARVVALTSERDHAQHLEDIGCDFVLDPHDIYVPMMVKASLSPAVPAWTREIILGSHQTPSIENIALVDGLAGKLYGTALRRLHSHRGAILLGIVRPSGRVLVNPPADRVLATGDRLLIVRPPAGGRTDTGSGIRIPKGPELSGRILVLSDKEDFISRILQELDLARIDREITIVSAVEPFAFLSDRINYRWVHESSHSSEGLVNAQAQNAAVAFIDHERDSSTLMSVLRLERISEGNCFAIACYREPDFDIRLRRVGCQFSLNANELIAPILTQSGRHYGMGYLIEEIISQHQESEGLFVTQLNDDWVPADWRTTVLTMKSEHGCLPVAIVDEEGGSLRTFPSAGDVVNPGDRLVVLTHTGDGVLGSVFHGSEDFDRDIALEETKFDERLGALDPSAVEDLRKQAEKGDAEAQVSLAHLYERGRSMERNPEEAFRWYEQAAAQGHSRALFKLGTFYYQGFGTEENPSKALTYLQKAANFGSIRARRTLADLKEIQRSVERQPLFNHDLFDHLDTEHRALYLKAVVRMALAGEKLGIYDKGYFKEAAQATRDAQLVHEIEQAVLFNEELSIEPVAGLTFLEQRMILAELAQIAANDGEPSANERRILAEVAALIAADHELVESEVSRALRSGPGSGTPDVSERSTSKASSSANEPPATGRLSTNEPVNVEERPGSSDGTSLVMNGRSSIHGTS